jgi:ribonuclease R
MVLDECFNHEAVDALQTAVLRTMSQARYTPIPTSHFGLAYESYCHFTSPIRRYPDLIVHRAIKNVLLNAQETKSDLHELGEHCSDTERKVEEAVRWVHGWLNASVARQHIGEEHIGRIVSIASFGCFIFIESLCLEGLLHVSELGHEFFYLEEGGVAFKGENSGKTYFLGDSVSITIRDADIETGRVTLKRKTSGHNKRYVKQ